MIVKNSDLAQSIRKTMDYAKIYGQKLDATQLQSRLISPTVWKDEEIKKLILREKIEVGKGRTAEAIRKTGLARKVFKDNFLRILPIEMMAITGSVAAGNPKKTDDIDLLIVTKNNRMWLVRPILIGWLWWKGVKLRRFGKEEEKDAFCLNLWLENDYLLIPKPKQTIRSAVDMINMVVIRGKEEMKVKMIKRNGWVRNFLATGVKKIIRKYEESDHFPNNLLIDWLNKIAFAWQYHNMRSKITSEIVNIHQAFYHPDRI